MERMWTFKIGRFTLHADITPSDQLDLSWDDTGEVREKLDSGEFYAFDTKVSVWQNGVEIASDWLCQSIYADAADFFTEHYGCKPLGYGSYFPDMVRQAISEARDWLADVRLAA